MARGRPSHKTQESSANAKVTHEIQLTKHSNLRSIYKNTGVQFFFTGGSKHRAKSVQTTVSRLKKIIIKKYVYLLSLG